ncbi:MAG TPA: DUF3309 domain-containing protein, partial [Bryobacteraceae bacterium]
AAQSLGQLQQAHFVLDHLLLRVHLKFSCPDYPDQSIENVRSSNGYCILLLILLVIILLGALPTWPYSRGWGYYPSGGLGLILIIILILVFVGYI